jgi:hypothetical protein
MWIVLILTGILILVEKQFPIDRLVFWSEVILLVLFGSSWLVKGKGLVDLGIQEEDNPN